MDRIRFLERIAVNGHPPLEAEEYDGWELRFSGGFTGRANSVSVFSPSGKGTAEKVAYCEKRYAEHGLPALFKVTDADPELREYLLERGYRTVTPTDVMTLDLERADLEGAAEGCVFEAEPSGWIPAYFALEEMTDPVKRNLYRRIVSKVQTDAIYCTVTRDGGAAACASAALEQGYMLLQNVIVHPGLRGQGLGEKICRAVLGKGKEQGAKQAYLQVVQDNAPALHLYRKLGFRKEYAYCYLK